MISNFGEFYRLANYLHRHTTKLIGLVMGVPTLREIFEEKYYTHLAGGILESFGTDVQERPEALRLSAPGPQTRTIVTAADLRVAPKLQHLYNYLIENQHIQPIRDYKPEYLSSSIFRATSIAGCRRATRRGSTTCRPTWRS